MRAVFYTNRGCSRKINEDSIFIAGCSVCGMDMTLPSCIECDTEDEVFCVIDGMGGYTGGAAASRIIAQAFHTVKSPDDALQKAFVEMHNTASRSPELSHMGATLAGAVIDREKNLILAFNLGDCRVYRLRDRFLEKLTHDHSRVQELFDSGEIAEEEMRTHPNKNIVTSGIMANESSVRDLYSRTFPFQDEDKFFACSDGVWEALPIDDIEQALSEKDEFAACSNLRERLFAAKCSDNVSFILISPSLKVIN